MELKNIPRTFWVALCVIGLMAGLALLSVPGTLTAGPAESTLYTYYNCTPGYHTVTGEREYDCSGELIYSWGTTTACYYQSTTCVD